jgi:uncharacterized protein
LTTAEGRPQRTCLGCRQSLDRDKLVRFVLHPAGGVVVDYQGKLPGRGAYTHIDADCIRNAVRRQQFDRAFRTKLDKMADDELVSDLVRQLLERVLNLLGMARKSGQALSGSGLVLDTLRGQDPPALLLLADDISEGVASKLLDKAGQRGVPCYRLVDKDMLGHLLGKGERSAVALKKGRLAQALEKELARYKQIVGES